MFDESHRCKNPTAARSKLAVKLVVSAGFCLWLSATAEFGARLIRRLERAGDCLRDHALVAARSGLVGSGDERVAGGQRMSGEAAAPLRARGVSHRRNL